MAYIIAKKDHYSTKAFRYYEEQKLFACDMSDIQMNQVPRVIYLQSARTGVVKPFFYKKGYYNADRELTHVEFINGDLKVHIFND